MSNEIEGTPAEPRYTLTRGEVATRLGISTSSVRRLEGVRLHPAQDDRGVWRFSEAELDAVPRAQSRLKTRRRQQVLSAGEVAARIFRMFESGRDLADVVIAARQPPALVRQLYREWLTSLQQGERDRQTRERDRQNRAAHERERRESAEDDRAQLEWTRGLGR